MKPVFTNESEALSAPYLPLKDYVSAKPVQRRPNQKAESGSIWMRVALFIIGFAIFSLMLWSASNV